MLRQLTQLRGLALGWDEPWWMQEDALERCWVKDRGNEVVADVDRCAAAVGGGEQLPRNSPSDEVSCRGNEHEQAGSGVEWRRMRGGAIEDEQEWALWCLYHPQLREQVDGVGGGDAFFAAIARSAEPAPASTSVCPATVPRPAPVAPARPPQPPSSAVLSAVRSFAKRVWLVLDPTRWWSL